MAVFIVVGVVGVALIVAALVFGDLLDGLVPHVSLGDAGLFSTEVVGSFLAAFGFVGALLAAGIAAPAGFAALGGLGAGVLVGAGTFMFSRSVMRMPTDATPRTADLVGALGTVVTPIRAGGYGEVVVRHLGQRLKLNARADSTLPAGCEVVVVAVASPTSVVVTEADL